MKNSQARTIWIVAIIGLLFFVEAGFHPARAQSGRPMAQRRENPIQVDDATVRLRVKSFLTAWLAHRDRTETLAFIQDDAYRQPPILGAACDGWYHRSDSPARAKDIVASNLINSANTHAKDTALGDILLLRTLPPEMKPFAINPVEEDRFFLTRVDVGSLLDLFQPGGRNQYRDMMQGLIKQDGPAYLAIVLTTLADGDSFGVYTIWQHIRGDWRITSIDIVCQ